MLKHIFASHVNAALYFLTWGILLSAGKLICKNAPRLYACCGDCTTYCGDIIHLRSFWPNIEALTEVAGSKMPDEAWVTIHPSKCSPSHFVSSGLFHAQSTSCHRSANICGRYCNDSRTKSYLLQCAGSATLHWQLPRRVVSS
jgi:hypothetical protein